MRSLLIHGARAIVRTRRKSKNTGEWLDRLIERKHANVATVALANKNARIVWALLAHDRRYESGYAQCVTA